MNNRSSSKFYRGIGKPAGCKLIRVDAEIMDGLIGRLDIRGDFFALPEDGFELVVAKLQAVAINDLAERFDTEMAKAKVSLSGISGSAVAEILTETINAQTLPTD